MAEGRASSDIVKQELDRVLHSKRFEKPRLAANWWRAFRNDA
jgi:hypothetical protein